MNQELALTTATALSLMLVGGGLYEFLVVNPYWPQRPDLIQPVRGGINRKRFWIPTHAGFELLLAVALYESWHDPSPRTWLIIGLATHVSMRIWSALDFIPKALFFERADKVNESAAKRWNRRSMLRFPLDLATSFSLLTALHSVLRG